MLQNGFELELKLSQYSEAWSVEGQVRVEIRMRWRGASADVQSQQGTE